MSKTLIQKLAESDNPKINALIPRIEAMGLDKMRGEYGEAITRDIECAVAEYYITNQLPNLKEITLTVARNQAWRQQHPHGDLVYDTKINERIHKAPTDEELINSLFGIKRNAIDKAGLSKLQETLDALQAEYRTLCKAVSDLPYYIVALDYEAQVCPSTADQFTKCWENIRTTQMQIAAIQCINSFEASNSTAKQESDVAEAHTSKDLISEESHAAAAPESANRIEPSPLPSLAIPEVATLLMQVPSSPPMPACIVEAPNPTHPSNPTEDMRAIWDSIPAPAAAAPSLHLQNLKEIWDSMPASSSASGGVSPAIVNPVDNILAKSSLEQALPAYVPSDNVSEYTDVRKSMMEYHNMAIAISAVDSANALDSSLAITGHCGALFPSHL